MYRFLACLAVLLLSGCSLTTPTSQTQAPSTAQTWRQHSQSVQKIQQWNMQGALGVRDNQQGFSSNFQWQQQQENYQLNLFGPLGIGNARIQGSPGNVTLQTSKNQTFSANSPESLMQQQLGWQLPLSYLSYWVRGIPAPGVKADYQLAQQRLQTLDQAGWHIQYLNYTNASGVSLPSKMYLTHPPLQVRIVIKQWNV